mgnify:CR=1 FL=1
MAIKYREAEDLRMTTRQELTSSPENWLKFLRTASNTYKYNFSDQLLIFAQFPNAKAVAVFDVWSKTFGRKIREGEKGIGLIDDKGEYPRIKYVFDISQSSPTQPKKQQPYIWELTEENHQEVAFLLSSDKNIENALADTVEDTVNEMIDDYVNNSLNEDNSIEPEKFRQLVCDSVKYMVLQRCGLDTSSYIDSDIFSSLNEFSNPDVIDILGESISNISEQALRKVEQTVKTIERRNQNERNNAQNKNDRWSRTSTVRVEHDILSNDNSGQDNWSKLHTRPGNIHIPSSSERRGGYEGRGSLGATSPQVSQRKQEKNIDKANRHTQTDRPLDRSQRSSRETDGTARSGNDGSRGSNRRTQNNRPDEVGTNDELNQSKSRGNSSEQSDIRITQENTVTQTAEDNSPAVFSFEQIGFFDSNFQQTEQQSEVDKFVNAVLMKGTGTEDGKFRVNGFFTENHTEKEKIDFLKDEFGWYGRYTSSESLESQPSKGLTLTRTDKENPENNLNIHLSWKEVVEHLDSMVSGKTYITEKDIAERQRHALYVLKNYSSDNPNDVYAIQKAKETLDSYNIDYNDILVSSNFKKIDQSEFINFASDIIKDKQRVINAHKNSNEQEYRLEIEIALNELVTELVTASMADEDFVITGYTAKETINFLNQYQSDTEMQKYVLDTVSENTDVVLSKIEETRQAAAKIGMAFSDKLYDSENDFDPFVYDGSMSIEDFRKVQDSILSEQKENEKTFAEQVDDVISGKIDRFSGNLKVCNTPQILLDVGCSQLPMFYTRNHLKKAILPKDRKKHQHGLTVEQIKKIPDELISPAIIMDSLTQNDSIIAILSDIDSENNPVIASIKPNGQGFYELEMQESNFITSIYGRENFEEFINRAINNNKILFIDKQKSQELFSVLGLEFSKGLNSLDFNTIIHQSHNIVNKNIVEEKYTSTQSEEKENIIIKPENYHISDLSLGQRKPLEKYQDNIAAIKTLKQLETENRTATPEEQEILSKYTGWGGMAKVFELGNGHYDEVKGLLTNDEYAAARKSAMSAFYTSPVIIKEIYSKLSDMGFSKGKLLEPSCGVGNFIGMIPQDMQAKITGIELDSLTGRIAKKLYPEAQIQICGFENSNLKSESFDVAVGNVPFGDIRVYDKKYNKENLLIHDYFFSKSLDMVKPGGVVAFITSKGTLDKRNDTARRLLAEKADFLGAVRLPNNAFKANAGTEVTSDIIFLQKRTEPITITSENEPLWIKTTKDENGIEMNAYFTQNPQQICGSMEMVSGQFGMESTCVPNRDTKLSVQIRNAMENIQGNISTKDTKLDNVDFVDEQVEIPDSLRTGSYFLSSDKVYFFEYGTATEVKLPKSNRKQNLERMAGLIAIRDTVRQLLEMQLDSRVTDDEIKDVQSVLSSLYDDFASKYGRINDDVNSSIFKNDSSLPLLRSLEKFDKDKYIGKADIFTKRTVNANKEITSVSTAVDALAVSLSDTAKVNLKYMSKLTGLDKEKLIEDLQGSIYRIPNTDKYVTADEYLSGNILQKLEEAQNAFDKGDTSLAINIQALEKAMPDKIQASDIDVRLGATWINPKYIKDFVYELLGTALYHKNPIFKKDFIDVQYSELTGKWYITNKSSDKNNVQATVTYGTKDRTAYELIEDILNLRATQIKSMQIVDGKEKLVVDNKKTAQVRAKQEIIQQKFQEWIFSDKTRRDDIVDTYNRIFNVNRPREYDGKYLNFVGMNPEIQLRPHQLNAVARCLYGGNTLLAHEVGAGKTFEMIAAAMEGKRLGLHNKSLMCVPNHLTEQMGEDFLKLYPNADILVAKKKDFVGDARRTLMAKIATGNYDAVIIGHSQLAKIPLSTENQERFIQNQIDELIKNIEEMKAHNGQNFQVKQAERTKANLEAKLKKLLDTPKDDTVTFEELGVDKLFLDEAHYFKNLFLSTKMTNVSGIATSDNVSKTADLYMKTQYLDEITNGKGLVFATGTPVSNTICEIYNMMKYLQSDLLKEKNLWHFDSWASTFGESVTQMELAPEGNTYRAKTRFAKFHNLPELMNLFKECADIQTADTLNLPNIPDCEIHNISCEPTEIQKQLVETLAERAVKIHNHEVDPHEDNMPKITTDGRKIGLDQRLINPDLPDEPGTKVNACVENVLKIWKDTQEQRSTQLIFCDYSTPKKDGSFNIYDDIKKKLLAKGVPPDEIAFIHDATTEAAKEELFSKVRSGEVRVLIGSTSKMGAGTNVQTKLVASHDLDAPFRPADMEQRRGRMVRQGNENKQVHLYRYCTKDTFDAYLFQMLERKQKFISQIMTSKSPQRRCDDVDEATLSYAEVKALCVGDPRIKEKMELDNEVAKLILERSGYQQEQYRLEDMAASLTSKIEILENIIPKNQNDFLYYQKNHSTSDGDKKKFEGITINGQQYSKKDEAAEALKQAYIKACSNGNNKYTPIGKYKGFEVAVMFDCFSKEYKASLTRECTYYLDLGTDNFTRMDNVLEKLEDTCKERIERLSEHKKSLKEAKEQIGKPFYKETEYQTKSAKLAELNAELDVDGRKDNIDDIEDTKEVSQNIVQKR